MALCALLVCLMLGAAPCAASAQGKDPVSSALTLTVGKWVKTSRGLLYQGASGRYARNAWIRVHGSVYYIGADAYARTGWFYYLKKLYYADAHGRVYYNRWLTDGDKKNYFLPSGECAAKLWVKLGGKYYYFAENTRLVTDSFVGDYYVGPSGARQSSCWVKKDGKLYYLAKDGKRLRNVWLKYSGKYYYLQQDGSMARSCWVGKYYVGKDGVRKTSCWVQGYWLNANGVKVTVPFTGKYIFVGDSRMVGMSEAVSSSKAIFVSRNNTGYDWLNTTAGTTLRKYLDATANVKVIFAHGVNDPDNLSKYIAWYRKFKEEYPEICFYFLSVNPVDYPKAYASGFRWTTNQLIEAFNARLKAAFADQFVDTYTYLKAGGFDTVDGLHYTAGTSRKIYNYVIQKLA